MDDSDRNERRRRGERADQVGAMAHKKVASWLQDEGVNTNDATHDRGGWDLLAHFVGQGSKSVLLPNGEPELSCLVQVKGTDASDDIRVTLSSIRRLVEHPLPSFFVYVAYDGGNTPHAVSLVHVDEGVIHDVLKRMRELAVENSRLLNDATFSLGHSRMKRLEPPWSKSLVSAIRALVAEKKNYTQWKLDCLRNVGLDKRPFYLMFNAAGSSDDARYSALSDWAIGLIDELPVVEMVATEHRFGIALPVPEFEGSVGGTLRISDPQTGRCPSLQNVLCRARSNARSVYSEVSGELLSSEILGPHIPKAFQKYRFIGGNVDLILPRFGDSEHKGSGFRMAPRSRGRHEAR